MKLTVYNKVCNQSGYAKWLPSLLLIKASLFTGIAMERPNSRFNAPDRIH